MAEAATKTASLTETITDIPENATPEERMRLEMEAMRKEMIAMNKMLEQMKLEQEKKTLAYQMQRMEAYLKEVQATYENAKQQTSTEAKGLCHKFEASVHQMYSAIHKSFLNIRKQFLTFARAGKGKAAAAKTSLLSKVRSFRHRIGNAKDETKRKVQESVQSAKTSVKDSVTKAVRKELASVATTLDKGSQMLTQSRDAVSRLAHTDNIELAPDTQTALYLDSEKNKPSKAYEDAYTVYAGNLRIRYKLEEPKPGKQPTLMAIGAIPKSNDSASWDKKNLHNSIREWRSYKDDENPVLATNIPYPIHSPEQLKVVSREIIASNIAPCFKEAAASDGRFFQKINQQTLKKKAEYRAQREAQPIVRALNQLKDKKPMLAR